MTIPFGISPGKPTPFGVSLLEDGVNFSLHSKSATEVVLCLFDFENKQPICEISLNPSQHRTGDVWHVLVHQLPERMCYAYRVAKAKGKLYKRYYNRDNLLLDPHAKALATPNEWGRFDQEYRSLGVVISKHLFDWEDDKPLNIPIHELVLYEMHVRGFTRHESSGVQHRGKFLGIIEKIPYLLDLGINAVKLMPIHEYNECEYGRFNPFSGERLCNFWGYSTVNFFSPMNRYASNDDFASAIFDFKTMVKELHRHGIEVILDVVFNHTAEGNEHGPIFSFKGIDCPIYYMMDKKHRFQNFTGCGNTVNCNHSIVREFIRTCLQYWVTEMHVDGFRFDLGAVMSRDIHGEPLANPPLIEELSHDPILSDTKLIAEPWDCGGLYRLGGFFPEEDRWSEWNDKYRDTVRRFIKGDRNEKSEFATRLFGSVDLFGNRSPCASINFITVHDGFTLKDLVAYNHKSNSGNAEDNRDGNSNNYSWNCGLEGDTDDSEVLTLRERQMRNFHFCLMVSLGVPLLMMGNEYGHTRYGNNNAWCQDNALNWFLWNEIDANASFFRFYKEMIHFRKRHKILQSAQFLQGEDIDWHSTKPFDPDWHGDTQVLAYTVNAREEGYRLYAAFNMHNCDIPFTLPPPPEGKTWRLIVHTANPSPEDFYEESRAPQIHDEAMTLPHHSIILLKAC
ncbi:MAG: isoamylase [Waddliaceae bacterium]